MSEHDEVENPSLDILETEADDYSSVGHLGDDISPKTPLEERQEKMKRSRWNVLMYLGLATILFSFSLFPMTTEMEVGYAKDYETGYIFGIPVAGADYTDVPVEIIIEVDTVPIDASKIEVFMIQADYCTKTIDGSITDYKDEDGNTLAQLQIATRNEQTHQRQLQTIEDISPGETYTLNFEIDSGSYCVQIITETSRGLEVKLDVTYKMYPFQIVGGASALICLLLSVFAFVGAQKHGKKVREAMNPNKRVSLEHQVLSQTSDDRISAGPRGGPTSGPSAPPSGPSAPPSGPRAPPSGPASGPSAPPSGPSAPPSGPSAPPSGPASGPSAPPSGPSAPPSGPSAPPSGPPVGPPVEEVTVETEPIHTPDPTPESAPEPIAEPVPVEEVNTPIVVESDVYEDQGGGFFFRKLPDGSYDQTVFWCDEDGNYHPYVPDA